MSVDLEPAGDGTASSTASDDSSSDCDSHESDLTRFNRLLTGAVTRRWSHFRDNKLVPKIRARSASDFGLSEIVSTDVRRNPKYHIRRCGLNFVHQHDIYGNCKHRSQSIIPQLRVTSAGSEQDVGQVVISNSHADGKNRQLLFVPPPTTHGVPEGFLTSKSNQFTLPLPYFKYVLEAVQDNEGFKLYWDHPILTDRMLGEQDIVVIYKTNNKAIFEDITIPYDVKL